MDLGIKDKTALVLGAGGGIGRAVALKFVEEGVKVALADINEDALLETKRIVEAAGGKATALKWDLADISVIEKNVDQIGNDLGGVDILFNNTGGPPPTQTQGLEADLWTQNFQSMVLSIVKIADQVLPAMKENKWGRIVTSASSGVVAPIPNLAISNALRLSLIGWSKTLAREVAASGITSNVILPGRIATDRIRFLDEAKAKRENRNISDVIDESVSTIPIHRYGTPQEYADVAVFLASERASFMTGSTVRVDGGMIASI